MIKTRERVPEIYTTSADMLVFLGLLDILANSRRVDIERMRNHHNGKNCFEEDIKALSSLFNLNTSKREAIYNYKQIMKYKGTIKSVEDVLVVSGCNKGSFEVSYIRAKKETDPVDAPFLDIPVVSISVEQSANIDYELMLALLGKVIPSSVSIDLIIVEKLN